MSTITPLAMMSWLKGPRHERRNGLKKSPVLLPKTYANWQKISPPNNLLQSVWELRWNVIMVVVKPFVR